jgi:hypothetical protein
MITGVVGGRMHDLERLRTGVVTSRLVTRKAQRSLIDAGIEGVRIGAQVVMGDALGDRWVFVLQVHGDSLDAGEEVLRETLEQILLEGVAGEELEADLGTLEGLLERGFGQSRYWATRMSLMGAHGRSMEELWTIREGYAAVGVDEVDSMLRGLMARPDWFRIETVSGE